MDRDYYTMLSIALQSYALLLVVMLLVGAYQKNMTAKRRLLMTAMLFHALALVGSLSFRILLGMPGPWVHAAISLGVFTSFLFGPLACLAIMVYIYTDVSAQPLEDVRSSWLVNCLWIATAINLIVFFSNALTGGYYTITPENTLVFGPFIALPSVLVLIQAIIVIPLALRLHKHNGPLMTLRLLICGLLVLGACLARFCYPRLSLVYPAVSVMFALLAVGVQSRLEEELAQARADAAESRVRLLAGQIHPHFIFNALSEIRELVVIDPVLAEQTIQDFSDYLRSHLDEMSSSRLVPFEQELSHVHHYVSLEMCDASRSLEMRYDLPVTDFMVPPLTVQPLVENAIRHGIRTRADGGLVTVSTCRTPEGVEVRVTDDGRGLSSATERQDQRRRVGIENVRERLERQCGGTLTVTSSSQGTTAVMSIPEGGVR